MAPTFGGIHRGTSPSCVDQDGVPFIHHLAQSPQDGKADLLLACLEAASTHSAPDADSPEGGDTSSKQRMDVFWEENRNSNGDTALHAAVLAGNIRTVDLLLRHGAPVDATTSQGHQTALHLACSHLDAEDPLTAAVVQTLLDWGANPNILNNDMDTPMHLCAADPQKQALAELLLSTGKVDLRLKNRVGQSALDLARDCCGGRNSAMYRALAGDPGILEDDGFSVFQSDDKGGSWGGSGGGIGSRRGSQDFIDEESLPVSLLRVSGSAVGEWASLSLLSGSLLDEDIVFDLAAFNRDIEDELEAGTVPFL